MINTRKILLGMALLGAMTGASFSAPAQAKDKNKGRNKDVKEARKDVEKARRDVRRADSPEERRDAREDLRDEQRDLREERRENRRGNGRGNGYRPGYKSPGATRPGYGYGRPGSGYNRPNYGRPNYNRPGNNNGQRSVEGVVTQDLDGNDFLIRASNGRIVRVLAFNGENGSISRGDTVRAFGSYSNSIFRASSVTILRNR